MTALDSHGHAHDHPAHLAHHWDNTTQQFEAGKLGMWLFLATEVLLFGGLFCGYSVWRHNHPELFSYGSRFLDIKWGAVNTVVLICSSLTMAWGVTCAQQNKQLGLKICLILTLAGAAAFLGIKYVEYSHKIHMGLVAGPGFYSPPHHGGAAHGEHAPPAADHATPAPVATGAATARAGTTSEIVPVHPEGAAPAPAPAPAASVRLAETASILTSAEARPAADAPTIAPAAVGPEGLVPGALSDEASHHAAAAHAHGSAVHPLEDPQRPHTVHMFFNIYYMMTGLHGVHVLVGMIVITWLLIRSFKGHFNSEYFTPVDLGGLYWHVVDLIWIFLFPLFYLIH